MKTLNPLFLAELADIGEALDWYKEEDAVGFLASIGGAILLLLLLRLVMKSRKR